MLQKQVWVAGIKEQPIPNTLFVSASTDMSEYVENNTLHLAEAGIEPGVYEDYFSGNETELPTANIQDIPGQVVLRTYSTEQTRHRNLQDVELQYDKRKSIVARHKTAIIKKIAARAADAWTPSLSNGFNKILNLAANDSIIDAIIDLEAFYSDLDMIDNLNINLNAKHMARIKKENKVLYKEILAEGTLYGFKVHRYSKSPYYTAAGVKIPFGAIPANTDKQCSFTWCSDEVFRCLGSTDMYATLGHAGLQADILSFGQRALVGNIRASNIKYLGAII